MDSLNETKGGFLLSDIHPGKEGECKMCKFVLIFAFVVLLLVLCFVFFLRPHQAPPAQIPIQETQPLSVSEMDQRILDLKSSDEPSEPIAPLDPPRVPPLR
jgi:hypothetical protein